MSALIKAARAALNYIEEPPAKLWPAGTLHRITINLRTALAAAEAQPVGEPFGYVITNNVPESSPYRHVFYRPSEISAAYKDNALYSTPVYTAPPEWLSRFHHLMKKHGLHPSTMKRGGFYNWKSQPDRLIYLRRFDGWHQFKKIGDPREVWCEVQDSDLHMLEETAPPAQPAAQPLTDEQIAVLVLATVYDGDCSTPHRDAWAAEIGVPFARAIERAHGIGEGA